MRVVLLFALGIALVAVLVAIPMVANAQDTVSWSITALEEDDCPSDRTYCFDVSRTSFEAGTTVNATFTNPLDNGATHDALVELDGTWDTNHEDTAREDADAGVKDISPGNTSSFQFTVPDDRQEFYLWDDVTGHESLGAWETISVIGSGGGGYDVAANSNSDFDPQSITVSVRETVTWKNTAGFAHTVTSYDVPQGASSFDSGNLDPQETFDHTFQTAGTYKYRCEYHSSSSDGGYSGMVGEVVVKEGKDGGDGGSGIDRVSLQRRSGEAIGGAIVMLLQSPGQAGTFTLSESKVSDASGTARFTSPAGSSDLIAILDGHELAIVPVSAAGSDNTVELPARQAPTQPYNHGEVQDVADSVQSARSFELGPISAGQQRQVDLGGFAGLDQVDFEAEQSVQDARLVAVTFDGKPTSRLPDPQATVRSWFALELGDNQGERVPVAASELNLEPPSELGDQDDLLISRFDTAEERWDATEAEFDNGTGAYRANFDSLSLFAISVEGPNLAAIILNLVQSRPLLVIGLAAVLGLAGMAAVVTQRRRAKGKTSLLSDLRRSSRQKEPEMTEVDHHSQTDLPESEMLVSDVSVFAEGTRILDNVSFSLKKGEILAIMGPSGSGKSTLVEALLGARETDGEISVFGLRPNQDKEQLRRAAGYVSQTLQLYPDMTVRENVDYFGRQFDLGPAQLQERIPSLLETLGIQNKAHEELDNLSGGERRRVSIAATLIRSPEILFLDEPTSGLDPIARGNLWRFLKRTNEEFGVTILATTHFLDEAQHANKLLILEDGRVAAAGDLVELIRSLPGGGKAVVAEVDYLSEDLREDILRVVQEEPEYDMVQHVVFSQYEVKFFVSDPASATRVLVDLFHELGTSTQSIRTEDCTVADVFRYHAEDALEDMED